VADGQRGGPRGARRQGSGVVGACREGKDLDACAFERKWAMILEPGEKVHIVERRYFTDDVRRHLIGEVLKCTTQSVRIKGYVWVFDNVNGRFVRKPEKRERIVYLGNRLTINVIPPEVDLEAVKYVADPQKGLQVTDGKEFFLEVTEFTVMR
jgi:hypothetical protein